MNKFMGGVGLLIGEYKMKLVSERKLAVLCDGNIDDHSTLNAWSELMSSFVSHYYRHDGKTETKVEMIIDGNSLNLVLRTYSNLLSTLQKEEVDGSVQP